MCTCQTNPLEHTQRGRTASLTFEIGYYQSMSSIVVDMFVCINRMDLYAK